MVLDTSLVEQLSTQANDILDGIEPIAKAWQIDPTVLPDDINEVFRGLHTIKGGFGFFGLDNIKSLCHALEDYLSDVRSMMVNLTDERVEVIIDAFTRLRELCGDVWNADDKNIDDILQRLGFSGFSAQHEAIVLEHQQWPLEPSEKQCEQALRMSRNIYRITLKTHKDIEDNGLTLLDMNDMLIAMGNPLTVCVGTDEISGLDDCLELDLSYQVLLMSKVKLGDLQMTLDVEGEQIEQIELEQYLASSAGHSINGIHYLLKSLCDSTKSMVSELSKQVEFSYDIQDCDIDNTLRLALQSSFIHLLRNAIDHGIEHTQQREAAGKPAAGSIQLCVHLESPSIHISIKDDGFGIDGQRVVEKANERGLLDEDQELSYQQACELIFAPGFSTNDQVTEFSGRGVGMDVVKSQIEEVGGTLSVRSELGAGTEFQIVLPMPSSCD